MSARNELRCPASRGDKQRCLGVKLRGDPEHITVQRSTQALIGPDQNNRTLADLTNLKQWMLEITHTGGGFPLDLVQQSAKWTSDSRGVLSFMHFGGCHHLHGLGELRRAGYGLDPPPQIARTIHGCDSYPRREIMMGRRPSFHFQLPLNWSAAVLSSFVKAGLSCFSWPILRNKSSLRVVKNSVSWSWNSLIRSTGTSST